MIYKILKQDLSDELARFAKILLLFAFTGWDLYNDNKYLRIIASESEFSRRIWKNDKYTSNYEKGSIQDECE